MGTDHDQPTGSTQGTPSGQGLAIINVVGGRILLLIGFAVAGLSLLIMGSGGGGGWGGVAVGVARAFLFKAFLFSFFILLPFGWFLYRTPLEFAMSQGMVVPEDWSGCSQAIRMGNFPQRAQEVIATRSPANIDNLEEISGIIFKSDRSRV